MDKDYWRLLPVIIYLNDSYENDMVHLEVVSSLMHDIFNNSVPKNVQKLFNCLSSIHNNINILDPQLWSITFMFSANFGTT